MGFRKVLFIRGEGLNFMGVGGGLGFMFRRYFVR